MNSSVVEAKSSASSFVAILTFIVIAAFVFGLVFYFRGPSGVFSIEDFDNFERDVAFLDNAMGNLVPSVSEGSGLISEAGNIDIDM